MEVGVCSRPLMIGRIKDLALLFKGNFVCWSNAKGFLEELLAGSASHSADQLDCLKWKKFKMSDSAVCRFAGNHSLRGKRTI
jgi:hypothetical protein